VDSLLFPYFPIPVELASGIADPAEARRLAGDGLRLIQIRLYAFCEKAHHPVKAILSDYQKAREWLDGICGFKKAVVRDSSARGAL
jgi:hypothetical protein